MLFHVMAQHDHQTCEGAMRARGESVAPRNETERWLEGNDKVKVLTALGYISEHRYYAIVDSDSYSDVNLLMQGHVFRGSVEILPCLDMIERRKDQGEWGNNPSFRRPKHRPIFRRLYAARRIQCTN
ncbi:MAG: hypothetical protein CM1200mP22_29550 [Dehalococcoidia bacterium]|nr:MAG: hypothetical protein CM1200mP22_29550 [Dehalococcoidia bacterium]